MNDYLSRLVAKSLNTREFIRPRRTSRFEPAPITVEPSTKSYFNSEANASTAIKNEGPATRRSSGRPLVESVSDKLKPNDITHKDRITPGASDKSQVEKKQQQTPALPLKKGSQQFSSKDSEQYQNSKPLKPSQELFATMPISLNDKVITDQPLEFFERRLVSKKVQSPSETQPSSHYKEPVPSSALLQPLARKTPKSISEISINPFLSLDQENPLPSQWNKQRSIHSTRRPEFASQQEPYPIGLSNHERTSPPLETRVKTNTGSRVMWRNEIATRALPRLGEQKESESVVKVNIGRVEVRASVQPALQTQRPSPWSPKLSLDDYLKRRKEG